jgi:hypothetical protein
MSLALLFHYLMLNMFRMLVHPSSGAYDLFVELFHGLYCSGSMRVGVTLWFGWGGVVSLCRLKHLLQPAYKKYKNKENTYELKRWLRPTAYWLWDATTFSIRTFNGLFRRGKSALVKLPALLHLS